MQTYQRNTKDSPRPGRIGDECEVPRSDHEQQGTNGHHSYGQRDQAGPVVEVEQLEEYCEGQDELRETREHDEPHGDTAQDVRCNVPVTQAKRAVVSGPVKGGQWL